MNFYKYKLVFYPKDAVEETETLVGIAVSRSLSEATSAVISALCDEIDVEAIEVAPLASCDNTGVLIMKDEDAIKQLEDGITY